MVDIIHTDYGYYGVNKYTGTVDFFPNNGSRIQPGCPLNATFYSSEGTPLFFFRILIKINYTLYIFRLLFDTDFCSHQRSWRFYAESLINESAFLGVQCSSFSRFMTGKCNNNTLITMGYATPSSASVKKSRV